MKVATLLLCLTAVVPTKTWAQAEPSERLTKLHAFIKSTVYTFNYPKIDRERCIGYGRCCVSCMDGGHQAIVFNPDTRQPRIVGTKCVGCHLCRLVCPTGAIGVTKRINKKAESITFDISS